MKGKLLGFAAALLAVATIGVVQLQANAVQGARECDQYAVIRCGTMSAQEARDKYDQGSVIFQAMGISKSAISGNIKKGVVYRDGRVVVGGKTVATGARTAIRNMSGGQRIAGTNAAIYPTSRSAHDHEALVKFDQNGRFVFAISTPCGNPVKATPTPPPTPQPQPSAVCKKLTVDKISRTKFRFNAHVKVENGAKIKSYTYTVTQGGKTILNKTVPSDHYTFTSSKPGNYKVRLTGNTTVDKKTGPDCVKTFSITAVPVVKNPGIEVTKTVEHEKYKRVGVNVEYEYEIAVKNTGDKDLTNVAVTDTPQKGITLISASAGTIASNVWSYTIPSLKQGESKGFILKAKVPVYLAGMLKNTVCVDAPEVPGSPDDCDSADVDVPKPGETPETMQVCVIETKQIETIDKSEFDSALHTTDLSQCEETPSVTELPETGPADLAMQLLGVASLTGASAYYVNSRRRL